MISGTVYGPADHEFQLRLVGEITVDPVIENNRSLVKMWIYLHFPYGTFTADRYCEMAITDADENVYTSKVLAPDFSSKHYTSVEIGYFEQYVEHRDDGTQAVRLGAQFNVDKTIGGHHIGSIYVETGDLVLEEIPRASQIVSQTASVVVDGTNAWAVSVARKNENFTNVATLTFGDLSLESNSFKDEAFVKIPVEWLEKIPTQQKSTVDVAIQTYLDKTPIANPVLTTFEIVVPPDFGPTVTDATEWVEVKAVNPIDTWENFVFGHSLLQASFYSDYIETKHGAYIAGVSVKLDGATYSITEPDNGEWIVQTGMMASAGEKTVTVRVTDSRGFYYEKDKAITVYPYYKPVLTDISVYRCDASGNADDKGTNAYIKTSVNYAPCGEKNNEENSVKITATFDSGNPIELTNGVGEIVEGIAIDQSYIVTITAEDMLENIGQYVHKIPTAFATCNALEGGEGFAFGGYASKKNTLEVIGWGLHVDKSGYFGGDVKVDGHGSFGGGVDGIMRYVKNIPVPTGKYWFDGKPIYAVAFRIDFQGGSQTVGEELPQGTYVYEILTMRGAITYGNHGYQMLPAEGIKVTRKSDLMFKIESEDASISSGYGVLIVEFTYY